MEFVEIDNLLKSYSNITPIIALFAGAWIGNKYAINKDRRAEFLAVSAPLHDILTAQLHAQDNGVFANPASERELLRLRSRYFQRTLVDRIKGIGFDKAVKQYQEQYQKSYTVDNSGRVVFRDHGDYLKTIINLIKYTPIK
jgi:hypothetical protein